MQPQFQKAVLSSRLQEEADMGPKDHLLAPERCVFLRTTRDTTVPPIAPPTDAYVIGPQ